jgi:uncharacterized protein YcfJ
MRSWLQRWKCVLIEIGAAIVLGVVTVASEATKDSAPKYTPVEAACKMLNQGDTPQKALEAMRILLRQHRDQFPDTSAAARASVDRAVAQGCG